MELNLLLTSDQHCQFDVSKIPNDFPIDIALCSGDFCNLKGEDYTNSVKCNEAESQIAQFLQQLEKRAKQVYFIPGNVKKIMLLTAC